ncbi:MAG: hypothetical protein JKY56_19495, partial [Kofleriaceae bacterium]|nr:hypothetical protein [Kofleriaceae bacterium]
LDMRSYNPTEVARTLDVPLLILYGEKDEQVFEKDFLYWKEQLGDKRASFRKYPTLNHIFFDDKGSGVSGNGRAGKFVDRTVIEDIVHWITKGDGSMDTLP